MKDIFTAKAEIVVHAPAIKVWKALTDPEMIREYLFGTTVETDWKVGSPITYKGEWEGKSYEDKGTILEIEPGDSLRMSYWSSFSGTADAPENYQFVEYRLTPVEEGTLLTISQENAPTQEAADHSAQNWHSVLEKLKQLVESPEA